MTEEAVEYITLEFDARYSTVGLYTSGLSKEESSRLNTALWDFTWKLERASFYATNERNIQNWTFSLYYSHEDKESTEQLRKEFVDIINEATDISKPIKFVGW